MLSGVQLCRALSISFTTFLCEIILPMDASPHTICRLHRDVRLAVTTRLQRDVKPYTGLLHPIRAAVR